MARAQTRVIAFYLPQYHPVPENDRWWGLGFTEWTDAANAKPLFRGHQQPNLPGELGFYDLRVPETRLAQADLARAHGVEAFCYWHYWFAGERLLERPFQEVLNSGKPDFPFCLGWANHSWKGAWSGAPNRVLKQQTYPGLADHKQHFATLLPAFRDPRYLTVDEKPVFLVYRPQTIPGCATVVRLWRSLAEKAGLPGLHLVGIGTPDWSPEPLGFDGFTVTALRPEHRWRTRIRDHRLTNAAWRRVFRAPLNRYPYDDVAGSFVLDEPPGREYYPCVLPNWDNTPRAGRHGWVLEDSTPARFGAVVRRAADRLAHLPAEHRIVFVQSWNEWAEGNYLEPDLRHGRGYLEALRDALIEQP